MRHLFLFLVFALVLYFGWFYANKKDKRMIKRFTKKHVAAVGIVFALAISGLLLMFYNAAVNLL